MTPNPETNSQPSVRESTRDQLDSKIRIPKEIADRFVQGQSIGNLKVMIYCAADPLSSSFPADISFPSQIEIKVNGNDIKANLRGIKNKPGSTRPADITDLVHKKPLYENTLTITYALTTKVITTSIRSTHCLLFEQKYYLIVNIVEQITPETLIGNLKTRGRITKGQVLKDSE